MDKKKKTFYITTAIAYTSRKPHIGNTYDPVLADTIARYKRMTGYDVFFLTGSDEHGQKIEEAAKANGIEPKEYVDKVAAQIREIWDCMNTSYDRFIRTTDPDHQDAVQKIFKSCMKKGIYIKGSTSASTACRANPSSPRPSLWTANAPTAGARFRTPARRRISCV